MNLRLNKQNAKQFIAEKHGINLMLCVVLLSLLSGCGGDGLDDGVELNEEATSTNDGGQVGSGSTDNGGASDAAGLNVSLTQTPEQQTQKAYATFVFSAESANDYQCLLDDELVADCLSPMTLMPIDEGEHRFSVAAMDSSGNLGVATDFTWTISPLFVEGQGSQLNSDLIKTTVQPAAAEPNSWRGIFRINCDFAHSSYNDPIVYPNQENAAHLHRFYGNTLTNHLSTATSLFTQGESSCQGNLLNLSSYWLPALLAPSYDPLSGERLLDSQGAPAWVAVPAVVGNDDEAHEIFYYSAGIDDLEAIQSIPLGLRMIAGNAMAQPGQEQDTSIVRWHCQSWGSDDAANPRFSTSIPECKAPDRVRLDIFFPSCWNGNDLDSFDHKSHMAYPVNEGGPNGTHCPSSHPVPIVRPSYHYAFGVKPDVYEPLTQTSRGWKLASDMYSSATDNVGGMSLHGDWINAWHPTVMQALLDNCIKQGLDCHDGNLANGYRLSGTRSGSQFEPEIINAGLGY